MKVPNPERFYEEDGQWWYKPENRHRQKTFPLTCEYCGDQFVPYPGRVKHGRFCDRQCAAWVIRKGHKPPPAGRGPKSRRWKGGRRLTRGGYVEVWMPDHPSLAGTKRKYVREHRLVMEGVLGRLLTATERVHHKNGDVADNRPENLELWELGHPPGQRAEEHAPHCPTCTCFKHKQRRLSA
jgi:hypothetical protein